MPPKQTIKTRIMHRESNFSRADVNKDERTVDLAFSSEVPVERFFGEEILDHSGKSVRLDRMADGAPLLLEHNYCEQIGVVTAAKIDSDRIGRATVKFSKSKRGSEIFDDVRDGIRSKVSVGYRVHKFEVDDDEDSYRAVDWEPYEISIVSIPADASVGVGRSDKQGDEYETLVIRNEELNMSDKDKQTQPEAKTRTAEKKDTTDKVDVKAERAAAMQGERNRISEIGAIARVHALDNADEHVDKGTSVEDYRKFALDAVAKKRDSEVTETTSQSGVHLGMSASERSKYSMLRAIRAASSGNWKEAGFERECSEAIAANLGRDARGIFVPTEVFGRALTTGTTGNLVGTDHTADAFIEMLRPNSIALALGARTMTGLVGNVDIPRQDSSAAFGWINEDGDSPDTSIDIGMITLSPKTISGSVPMSRRLMMQSSPSVEALVQADLLKGAALGIDNGVISGTGADAQPRGVVNTTGVATTTGLANFADMVAMWQKLAVANADQNTMAYAFDANGAGTLMTTPKDSGSGIMVMENGKVNGYNTAVSNQVPADKAIFGDWSQIVIGMWGVLDLMVDKSTKAKSGGTVLRVFQDVDVAVRHPQSFCVGSKA